MVFHEFHLFFIAQCKFFPRQEEIVPCHAFLTSILDNYHACKLRIRVSFCCFPDSCLVFKPFWHPHLTVIVSVWMMWILLVLCGLFVVNAQQVQNDTNARSNPLSCIACAANEVTCMSTAINSCKEQHACDTAMDAVSCVSCIAVANCGSDPSCSGCSDQISNIVSVKKLLAEKPNLAKQLASEESPESPVTLRSSTSYCRETQSLMKTCGTKCYSSPNQASCAANCLKGVGVQSNCANCLGRKIQCTVKNCLSFCAADANSAGCSSCVSRSCGSCNSDKSQGPADEESFVTALVALAAQPQPSSQQEAARSNPLSCIACAANEVTCMSTAINSCKEQHACDTAMDAVSCVSCIAAANCGSDPSCSGCSDQISNIVSVKKLLAEKPNLAKQLASEESPESPVTLRSSTSYCRETQSLMKTCGTKCYSSPNQASCAANCLKGVGVQSNCANCLGRKIQCTVKRCLSFCAADANRAACSSCVSRSCGSCNSDKSQGPADEESFVTALVALAAQPQPSSQQEESPESPVTLRSSTSYCRETQSLMKTCGTKCYSSPNQASCAANCLKGVGVQSNCANCLGRKIQCTVKSCLSFCAADANSAGCSSCVSRSCGSCNSDKSQGPADEESFVTALVALAAQPQPSSQQEESPESPVTLRSSTSYCRETQSLMKTCGTKCYSSPNQASCAANCLKGVGVQSNCANCLGRKIQCTVKNCLSFCAADANSAGCSSCVSRSCGSCNSDKSQGPADEESFVTALVALAAQPQPSSQQEAARSNPLSCIACAANEVTCMSTAINSCKEQHACDTAMDAVSCVSCIAAANCGSDPSCSGCSDQISNIVSVKKLLAEKPNLAKQLASEESPESPVTLRSSTSYCRETQSLMKTCGTKCYSSPNQASCAANCLKGVGVQSNCANCLGRKIQCTVKSCLSFCAADANRAACSSCVSRSCGSCNSDKSQGPADEESFVTALVALAAQPQPSSQQEESPESPVTLRSSTSYCRETQSLMKTCGTKCYSSPNLASCAANCLKGVGVQSNCANCLGRKIQCTVKSCLSFCAADANSAGCSSCVSRSCGSCNSDKSQGPADEESFVTALVALAAQPQPSSQQEESPESPVTLRGSTSYCRETQSLMKTCGTKCYSSPNQASCAANCLKGVGVQSNCANCLGRKIQCTVKSCLSFCAADANSAGCSSCVSRSCGSCNSDKSQGPADEESFVTALVALSKSQDVKQLSVFP